MADCKCRVCGSKNWTAGGICGSCGEMFPEPRAKKPEAIDPGAIKVERVYCPVCKRTVAREKRDDGYLICIGCSNAFEPATFVVSHHDPAIAAEKDEAFEERKKHARSRGY